jgi:hypothetical protein
VAIPVQENGGIASLSRPVIETNPADYSGRYRCLTADTEPGIGNPCRVKGANAGQSREAIPQIVRHDGTNHSSPFVTGERMTTNRRQTGSSKCLEDQTLRPSRI